MKIIDAHLHFSNREGFKQTARNYGQVIYSAEGLKKEFEASHVTAGIAMGTPSRELEEPYGAPEEFLLEDGTLKQLYSCVGVNPLRLLQEKEKELTYIESQLKLDKVVGIKLYAGYFPYYVYDALYQPVYELASHYHVPVAIHCGDTQSPHGLLKYAHPLTVDEVAVSYPEITFIICHMGSPWVLDTAELITKNANVYTDLSGLLAGNKKHVKKMRKNKNFLQVYKQSLAFSGCYEKVLFGTDWPLVPIEPYIKFVKKMIPEQYHKMVFYKNALKVFDKITLKD